MLLKQTGQDTKVVIEVISMSSSSRMGSFLTDDRDALLGRFDLLGRREFVERRAHVGVMPIAEMMNAMK